MKTQMIVVIVSLVVFLGVFLGALGCWLNYKTASDVLEQSFSELAAVAAEQVAAEIKIIQNAAIQMGVDPELSAPGTSVPRMQEIVAAQAALYGFTRGNVLDVNGDSYFDGNNYAERDYFKAAMQGNAFISDPTISKVTGKVSFLVAAPLWEGGVSGGRISGVVYFVPDEDFLNLIVEEISPSPSGYGYIINQNDISVADKERSLVGAESVFELLETDSSLKSLAEIEKRMIAGESGFGTHNYGGEKWVQGYAPIANTNGWSLGVMAHEKDFLSSYYLALFVTVGLTALFTLAGVCVAAVYSGHLVTLVRLCTVRISKLAKGDLTSAIESSTRKDELGVLQNSTRDLVEGLREVVADLGHLLREIAGRNLDVETRAAYNGDFAPLKAAAEEITASLNEAMRQIQQSSAQVKVGAEQVAAGAQTLAQGATEQASGIEELSATIGEISQEIGQSAEHARRAKERSDVSGAAVSESNRRMREMIAAMEDINHKSAQISRIVKTIDDIAFQTNILALNAAVEAARAGTAGKGFAVVADEVRNLAGKSAEAAKSTTALIEETVRAVEHGADIADVTAKAMESVVEGSSQIGVLIDDIAAASGRQAQAIVQVSQGVEQISGVVQENSATSEESAAASEELTGQARMMQDMVAQFHLKDETYTVV